MKKLLFLLLSLPLVALAQVAKLDTMRTGPRKATLAKYKTPKLYSYSFGIKVYGYEEYPQILDKVNTTDYNSDYLNGFILKINDNQISYRLSGSFINKDIAFDNTCEDCEKAKGNYNDNTLRLGFEKNFVYADLQPYFGFDLGYRRSIFKGLVSPVPQPNLLLTSPYEVKSQKNGFAISPILGLKISPFSHLTFAVESNLDLLYSYQKNERLYKDVSNTPTVNSYTKWEFILRPVGMFSVQYNFAEQF